MKRTFFYMYQELLKALVEIHGGHKQTKFNFVTILNLYNMLYSLQNSTYLNYKILFQYINYELHNYIHIYI